MQLKKRHQNKNPLWFYCVKYHIEIQIWKCPTHSNSGFVNNFHLMWSTLNILNMEGLMPSAMSFSLGNMLSHNNYTLICSSAFTFVSWRSECNGQHNRTGVNKLLIFFLCIRKSFWCISAENYGKKKSFFANHLHGWKLMFLTLVSGSIYGQYSYWVFYILPACFQNKPKSDFNKDSGPLNELYWSGIILFLIICASENLSNFSWHFGYLEIKVWALINYFNLGSESDFD